MNTPPCLITGIAASSGSNCENITATTANRVVSSDGYWITKTGELATAVTILKIAVPAGVSHGALCLIFDEKVALPDQVIVLTSSNQNSNFIPLQPESAGGRVDSSVFVHSPVLHIIVDLSRVRRYISVSIRCREPGAFVYVKYLNFFGCTTAGTQAPADLLSPTGSGDPYKEKRASSTRERAEPLLRRLQELNARHLDRRSTDSDQDASSLIRRHSRLTDIAVGAQPSPTRFSGVRDQSARVQPSASVHSSRARYAELAPPAVLESRPYDHVSAESIFQRSDKPQRKGKGHVDDEVSVGALIPVRPVPQVHVSNIRTGASEYSSLKLSMQESNSVRTPTLPGATLNPTTSHKGPMDHCTLTQLENYLLTEH